MIPSGMADEDLVNALAQYLDLEPIEKQALLERHCLRSRAESLVELLEMKMMLARTPARLAGRALSRRRLLSSWHAGLALSADG